MLLGNPTIKEAVEAKDSEMLTQAIEASVNVAAEKVLEDALKDQDENIKKARGARALLSEETKFYGKIIDALKAGKGSDTAFKQAVTGIDVVLPETVIDTVFDDLTTEHPIVKHLDVIRTNAKIKVHFANMGEVKKAAWGKTDGTITTEISGGFTELDAGMHKLSCYMPVPNSMIDLGPAYLDRFVRTLLYEALANGIDDAVINNLESSSGPLGMIANMSVSATTTNGKTTYTSQTAKSLTKWTPKGLASAIKALSKSKNGNPRNVTGRLFLIVNNLDYAETVKPAICVQNAMGDWVDKSPYAITIEQSPYVPEGKAILGIEKQYALALCANTIDGNLEYSDEYKFLEEVRTFKIKLYGNGQPKDENSFVLLDISGLKEASLLTVNNTVSTAQGS